MAMVIVSKEEETDHQALSEYKVPRDVADGTVDFRRQDEPHLFTRHRNTERSDADSEFCPDLMPIKGRPLEGACKSSSEGIMAEERAQNVAIEDIDTAGEPNCLKRCKSHEREDLSATSDISAGLCSGDSFLPGSPGCKAAEIQSNMVVPQAIEKLEGLSLAAEHSSDIVSDRENCVGEGRDSKHKRHFQDPSPPSSPRKKSCPTNGPTAAACAGGSALGVGGDGGSAPTPGVTAGGGATDGGGGGGGVEREGGGEGSGGREGSGGAGGGASGSGGGNGGGGGGAGSGFSGEKIARGELFERIVLRLIDMGYSVHKIHDVLKKGIPAGTFFEDAINILVDGLKEAHARTSGDDLRHPSTLECLFSGTYDYASSARKPCSFGTCGGSLIPLTAVLHLEKDELKAALDRCSVVTWGDRTALLTKLTTEVKAHLPLGFEIDCTRPETAPGMELCLLCLHLACSVCGGVNGEHASMCRLQQSCFVLQLMKDIENVFTADLGVRIGRTGVSGVSADETTDAQNARNNAQELAQAKINASVTNLTGLLQQNKTSNQDLPFEIGALFRERHYLWSSLCECLAGSSLDDMAMQKYLYLAVIAMLKVLAHYTQLRHLLNSSPSSVFRRRSGVSTSAADGGGPIDLKFTLSWLRSDTKPLQSWQAYFALPRKDPEFMEDRRVVAEAINNLYTTLTSHDDLQTSASATPQSSRLEASASGGWDEIAEIATAAGKEELAALYKKTLRPLQFRQATFVNGDHCFLPKIHDQSTLEASATRNESRDHRIAEEISSLLASPPFEWPLNWGSSIFLCIDDCRPGLIKALIIGPDDTPYQNGLFFFDILLPPGYPKEPPQVHFLNTGGGVVRFNANLCENGSVLLSLLGTWSGPSWHPTNSTLLQVLVSIQSLILVQQPFYNDPEHDEAPQTLVDEYNSEQRHNTLRSAILPFLSAPPKHFEQVMSLHLKLKRDEILKQCEEWANRSTQAHAASTLSAACTIRQLFGAT